METITRLTTSLQPLKPPPGICGSLGCVIGAHCRIGSRFTLYQNGTIAQVLGPIEIGSETIIGANAVVFDSVLGRCVVAGIPARVKIADLSDAAFAEFWDSIKG